MIKSFTDSDIGKTIWYIPAHAKADLNQWEQGVIKAFDNERQVASVVYLVNNPDILERFQEYTGALTDYRDLSFLRYVLREQP